jgi:ATP-dependent helicase/nuclease subunit A
MSVRAATLLDRNLVVTAGAGTGKTALLVERALNLIAGAGMTIESIAAITFTEKAAAELRQRLASGLDELRGLASTGAAAPADLATEARRSWAWLRESGVAPSQVASRALAALTGLDAASVSTIHAFCAEILRRYPAEAGVDPAFQVDEGTAYETLFADAWERFLLDEMGSRSPRADFWRKTLLLPGALPAIRDLGRALASFSIPASAVAQGARYVEAPHRDLFGDLAASVRGEALGILARATGMNPNMKDFLSASAEILDAFFEKGPDEMKAVRSPLTLDAYLGRAALPAPGAKLAGATGAEVTRLARRAQRLILLLSRVDETTVAAIVAAAAPLAARARERLLASGLASFDALLSLTRDLLARDVGVRRDLASRFRTLLVDEFQDTDPLQYEILFFIAEDDATAARDAYEARLSPGCLFIVGDPKQSIYRFRGADMRAYRRAVNRVLECGGEAVTLSVSYRSPAAILDPINDLFSAWIGPRSPEEAEFEPAYEPMTSARGLTGSPAAPGPRVEIWSVPAAGGAQDRRRAEAGAIASWIAGNAGSRSATGEPLRPKDVAVLFRALTNAPLYAQALRRAGIPFVVEGGKDFYERQEVGDLIAFLRAAANPNDGASVLAVMRSPLGGSPDAELARFAAGGGRLDRSDPLAADALTCPNVRRALNLLAGFRARMVGRSPDDVIRAALEETPLALLHASTFEGAQRLSNLRKIVARAEDLSRRGLSLEETLRHVEDEFQGERVEGESPLADETVDAVRLLSVHKAKGLEYPVVILPDVGRRSHAPAPGGEARAAWLRDESGGFLAVSLDAGVTNLAWAKLAEADRLHDAAEEKRVFYVACTRARERLILVNSDLSTKAAPWRDALAAVGYQARGGVPEPGLLGSGRIDHRIVEPSVAESPTGAAALDPIWSEAARTFEMAADAARSGAAAILRRPTGEREEAGERIEDAVEEGESAPPPRRAAGSGRDAARLAGSAVHEALASWDFRDAGALRASARRAAERLAGDDRGTGRGDAAATGLARETIAETGAIVEAFLATDLPARLASATILGREIPVLHQDGDGAIWRGYCDLVYRDAEGWIVVADYKTDRIDGDASFAEAVRRYRPQIETYRRALTRALQGPGVRSEILFLRTGRVESL